MFKEINELKDFLEKPSLKIHVREYAKKQKITPATASTRLKKLSEKGILKQEKIQNIHFYTLTNNQIVKDIKTFYTIQKVRKIIPHLNKHFGKPNIVLFGSTAKGENVDESDIDIYIESEITKEIDLSKLERIVKKPLQLFVYTNLKEVPNPHLQQNIMNGIVLQGEIQWN